MDVLTKRWNIMQHTDCWNRNAVSGVQKCGFATVDFMRRLFAEQKGSVSTDKESDIFEIQRRMKQCDLVSRLLFNTVLQMALSDDVERWQISKGMGFRLGDHESDCLTNFHFADDVLLFSTSLVQLQKMMCTFKQSTESVGLKIHPDKTNNLSNQSTNKRKKWRSTALKLRYYLRGRVRNILGNNHISATGNS